MNVFPTMPSTANLNNCSFVILKDSLLKIYISININGTAIIYCKVNKLIESIPPTYASFTNSPALPNNIAERTE